MGGDIFSFPCHFLSEKGEDLIPPYSYKEIPCMEKQYPLYLVYDCTIFREVSGGSRIVVTLV